MLPRWSTPPVTGTTAGSHQEGLQSGQRGSHGALLHACTLCNMLLRLVAAQLREHGQIGMAGLQLQAQQRRVSQLLGLSNLYRASRGLGMSALMPTVRQQ